MNLINKELIENITEKDIQRTGIALCPDFKDDGELSVVKPLTKKDVIEMGLKVTDVLP